MQLSESDEQRQLRESVRRFLAQTSPISAVRAQMAGELGHDPAVWQRAADELGLPAIAIPEQYGGAGYTAVEQAVVLEELGRALYCGPYLATAVLAANALLAGDDERAKREWLPGIASGALIGTLAFTEDDGSWSGQACTLTARADGAGPARGDYVLDGHKSFVLDGHVAGLILVVGRAPGGLSLFAVDGAAAGLRRTVLPTLDQTRRMARLEFDGTPARLVGAEGAAPQVLSTTLDTAALALAAEQLGGAQAALDMAVSYAKTRTQFDRPIGSFQAIKHRCADLLLELESTRSAVVYGAWAVAEGSSEVPVVAALAKAYASDSFFHIAGENIQIHGGIGFTWEHDAHLYFKRAKADEVFLGDAAYHRERLAVRIGL